MSESIREVVTTLLEAIGLVILVMFLFLQNWRTTLIPAITIPVSLVGTFAFVKLFGFSINTLTLFGITLATGLVVDDAIVVIENIERHIHEHHRPPARGGLGGDGRGDERRHRDGAGARRGVRAGRVLPGHDRPAVSAVRADDRRLDGDLGVQRADADAGARGAAARARWRSRRALFFRGVNRVIDGGTSALVSVLRGLIRVRVVVDARVRRRCSALTYWVYTRVPTGFVPDEDQGYIFILVQAPQGASLDYTMDIVKQVEQIAAEDARDSDTMFGVGGFSFAGSAPNQGIMFVHAEGLRPSGRATRTRRKAVVGQLFGAFSQITGAMVIPFLPPSINGLGTFGGFPYELLDQSGGPIEEPGRGGAAADRRRATRRRA